MTKKIAFFEWRSWFKVNNLGLALGTNLKFYTSVVKRSKLKVKVLGANSYVCRVTGEKLLGGGRGRWLFVPPPWIGLTTVTRNRKNVLPFLVKVVLNRATWYTFTQSQAKPKLPFPQYPFLTVFFNQKRVLRNENLSLSNLVHFYTILDTFVRFPYTIIRSWTLPYDPHTNVSINLPTSIKACPLNVFKLFIRLKISAKKKWIENNVEIYVNFRIFIKLFTTSNLSSYFEKVK